MKTKRFFILTAVIALLSTVLVGAIAAADLPEARVETDGLPKRDPVQAQEALRMLGTTGLLLIPDTLNARVMAFDPTTGDLVDPNFIPPDPTHLELPRNAILSASGDSLLVSDTEAGVVFEYDLLGNFVGIFAPSGGPDTNIMADSRGMALRPNGNLLVTVGTGPNSDAVAEFDTNGNYLGNFIENGAGGLTIPADIYQRSGDILVSSISNDKVLRFALETGNFIDNLASVNGVGQQLTETSTGNILLAMFNGSQKGIVELSPTGTLVKIYNPVSSYHGVYELPNGHLLMGTDGGVFEINRSGVIVDTKIDGVGGQFIELVSLPFPIFRGEKKAADNVLAGDPLTYTISVRNFGLNATGVVMTDAPPAGTSYIPGSLSCQGASGSCTFDSLNNQITWNGNIDNSDTLKITYALDTSAAECGVPISNQAVFSNPGTPFDTVLGHDAFAWFTANAFDFEANDGGFVANTPPGEWAWGALVPSLNSPPTAFSGSNLFATNLAGNITAEPSVHYLTKTLALDAGPSRLTWWDWWDTDGSDSGSVRVGGTEVYSITEDQLEWDFHTLDLTSWQNQTVDLSYFYAAGGTGDGGAGWYVDDVTVFGCAAADFSNSSKAAPVTAETGSQFPYTIVIDNSSIITATTTSLVDPIPAGLAYVYGSATGGAVFNAAQNQIEWNGDVAANSAVTITFMVEVTAESGWITNTATIDHSSTTAVEVSATTNILAVAEADFEIYLPMVLKPE
jgi:uncharacterized repeat protein (TIGR01451 family)